MVKQKQQNSRFEKVAIFFARSNFSKLNLYIIGLLLWTQVALCGDVEIVRAKYGADGNWKDVTNIVQSKVKDGALAIQVGNLLFGEPAAGQMKTLVMTVRCNGKESNISAEENATLIVNESSLEKSVLVEAWSIQKAIDDAYKNGERSIKLKPAIYRISPPLGKGAHLKLYAMRNFEVDATGSTLIFEKLESAGVVFENCHNVSFKGGIIRRSDFPFSQGDIIAIAADRSYVDIKIHDGYPVDMDSPYFKASPILTIFNSTNSKIKSDVLDLALRIKCIEKLTDRQFRFFFLSPFDARMPLGVGDMAAWRKLTREQVFMLNCSNMSFTGVTIKNAPALAVAERGGEGRNYYSYTVTYDDPPAGATHKPLLSTAADGFNSSSVRNGPILENCLWEGLHDDAVNIHGEISLVVEAEKDTVIINSKMLPGSLQIGDILQFYNQRCSFEVEAKVLAFEPLSDYHPLPKKLGNNPPKAFTDPSLAKYQRLKLDRVVPAAFGWYMIDLNACGAGYVIRNCTTRETRARGFLLSSNGIVENNVIERCSYGGIVVAPSFRGCGEGPYGNHLIIKNNIIREVGFATEFWNVGLTIGAWENGAFVPPPGGHRNILVEGNRFEKNDGPNIMISSAIGVEIKNNTFINPMHHAYHGLNPPLPPDSLIALTECRDVSFKNNEIINPGAFMKKIVGKTSSAFSSNADSGFKIEVSK